MWQKKIKLDYIFVTVAAGAVATGIGMYLKYMKSIDIKIIGV
jgi:threonine dehydratase